VRSRRQHFPNAWSEGIHDNMASRLHCVGNLANICRTVAKQGKKMKHCSVMPHIVSRTRQFDLCDIGDEPMHALKGLAQPFSVHIDGCLRDIEDCDVLVPTGEEVIDERGFTSAYIDNGCREVASGTFDELQRGLKVRSVPTDCVWSFLRVDLFPMSLCIHTDQPPLLFS